MATAPVQFTFHSGIVGEVFLGMRARLYGSWDATGRYSTQWSATEMVRDEPSTDSTAFRASVDIDVAEQRVTFRWGVSLVASDGSEIWAIATEVKDRASRERYRSFTFSGGPQSEAYYLVACTQLGANKFRHPDGSLRARFAVWAPNAQSVEVVIGKIWDRNDPQQAAATSSLPSADIAGGYIADDGTGRDPAYAPFTLSRSGDGTWQSDIDDPRLRDFRQLDHKPYMYRVVRDDGSIAYRTDLYSRCQIGYGAIKPRGQPYEGLLADLDGTGSCSVIVDPEMVTRDFREDLSEPPGAPGAVVVWPERYFVTDTEFWADEFGRSLPPSKIEDLIIYELHTGALGFGSPKPGTIADAIALLDHLLDVGVNTVELLPLSEFGGGGENWGYATSHYFAIEYSGGGRDQYKFFVKEAHKRGIAVIMDVVYNHYSHDAERAQWMYDTARHDSNAYYWYEGTPSQYSEPEGGYLDNMSTAHAPRYHEEMVRKLFIGSAAALIAEFHIDGLRVDQTTSIHSYNRLHADGREVNDANIFGAKLLRELSRTLRMIKPDVLLMAEDHSDWDEVTLASMDGGMGFDARWYADFYHHLAGDTDKGADYARLIYGSSQNICQPLHMDYFAGALMASGAKRIVYSESHDEAGNSKGPLRDPQWDPRDQDKEFTSHRTIVIAAGGAPLIGATRVYAEARCRFAYGVTVLSAGTPMFLFGEEVGAERRFKYGQVLENREDLSSLRGTTGANLFRFYADINRLRRSSPALRSREILMVHTCNATRVIAFLRSAGTERFLVVASLNDAPFDGGYDIAHPELAAAYKEVFNSDSYIYGGGNVGNLGARLESAGSRLRLILPANGLVVFQEM